MENKMEFSTLDALFEFLDDSSFMPLLKDIIMDDLAMLKAILIDAPRELVKDGTLQVLKSMGIDAESIFSSFDLEEMNAYMALELCMQLLELFKPVKDWPGLDRIYEKETRPLPLHSWPHVRRICDKERPSRVHYPKGKPFIFIDNLLEILDELVNDTAGSIRHLSHVISRIQREIQFWKFHLIEISSNPPLHIKKVIEIIGILAYEVEYVVDSYLVGDIPSWCCIFWLLDILKEFGEIEAEREDNEESNEDLEAKKLKMYDILVAGGQQLNVISFARDLDHIIKKVFSEACEASQPFNDHFGILLSFISTSGYDEEELYENLKGRRFLVVFDGIQSIIGWNDIRRCFPDCNNGSRIVFTNRMWELAIKSESTSILQLQSPLHDKKWDRISKTLFHNESCPAKLLDIGKCIAKRCKPSSLDLIVSLLETNEKTVPFWEEVAKELGSQIVGDALSQQIHVLDLTFMYLPDHLKSCFLYLVIYSHTIFLVSKLIRYWIAEGFILKSESQSLEETAQDYLTDLIVRQLIIFHETNSIGGAKRCMLDPIICSFLEYKNKDDNFANLELKDYDLESDESSSSTPTIYQQRCFFNIDQREDFFQLKPSGPFVKSLLVSNYYSKSAVSYEISFVFDNFKHLRMLTFERIDIEDSLIEIVHLVLLRYLAVESSANFIPSSIANLWNLETFFFKGLSDDKSSKLVKVPDSIWDMPKLRHLHISNNPRFDFEPHRLDQKNSSFLTNLQTFSKLSLACGDDTNKILRKLGSLRKLNCEFLDSWNDVKKCNEFPVLEFLNQVISLKVSYGGVGKYPCNFSFPSNLKKLTLSKFGMPWSEINQLKMLHNLEVLKLLDNAFEGERWKMEDDVVFPKLKYMKLKTLNIVEWSTTHDQFPSLENLFLINCYKLLEIPQDFAYSQTLRKIQGYSCSESCCISAELLKEEHMKLWGNHVDILVR